jgi:hypothetical protein
MEQGKKRRSLKADMNRKFFNTFTLGDKNEGSRNPPRNEKKIGKATKENQSD